MDYKDENMRLMQGDCLERMKEIPDGSVDSIVTDPPYGLSFMGKKWDYDVPSAEIWAEALRVLKPGGHLLAFAGTRTQHRMAVNIEDAGFEIRDMIAWIYGSGFPKSHNLKDKWDGWGTALKPALEPITVARKPFKGTVAANVLEHGTGAINIDGCRVGDFQNTTPSGVDRRNAKLAELGYRPGEYQMGEKVPDTPPGRWPANLILDGSDEVRAAFPEAKGQQGDIKGHTSTRQSPNGCFGKMAPAMDHLARVESDKSAARFFYCAKASKKDRNEGCEQIAARRYSHDGRQTPIENAYQRNASRASNNHPTVKPTDLMRYLCRLVTPPNGIVLDPFMGSGSTGKAAMLEGFRFIGVELDQDYFDIAKRRIGSANDD